MTLVNSRPELMNLSFSGCGFLCVYHAGVAAAIKEYAPHLLRNKILGASAGSIVACGLITNVCISHATTTILKVVGQARSRTAGPLHPEFNLLGIVREELETILPPNAYEMCTGRLIISLTRWSDHENVVIDNYISNADLIDAIMCSCFIPIYCGLTPPRFRGVQYIDGGVSDNQPIYDEHTVTVSPFSGESDICPPDWDSGSLFGLDFHGTSIRFTARNMFRLMACLWPRSTDDLSKMCLQGFGDAIRFLTKYGMAPCIRCLTIQTIDGGVNSRLSSECVSEVEEKKKYAPSPNTLNPIPGLNRMKKKNSANGLRNRGESECETCCDSDLLIDEVNISSFFPSIMKKPFEDAVVAEAPPFLQYVLSFRVVRYASTFMGITKFPLDMALAFVKKLVKNSEEFNFIRNYFARVHEYLDKMSPPRWIILKLTALADFILSEIEKQRSRYTNFSCIVDITETDKYGSTLSQKQMEHQEHREIEMNDVAKKEMRLLQERDRRKKNMAAKAGKTATQVVPETSSPDEPYDVDSYEHVIAFTRSHESLYEFHYMDENKRMRTFGLFADKHRNSSTHSHESSSTRLNHVPEEDEEPVKPTVFQGGVERGSEDEVDSGLSGIETKNGNMTSPTTSQPASKRDACCSPVRGFADSSVTNDHSSRATTRCRGNQRKYGNETMLRKQSSGATKKKSAVTVSMSSDSEEVDGTEKLFVPSRKAWRASSELEKETSTEPLSDTTP